ncbi:MAG TPA: SAM-dependent methyltransferase [Acholeplasmataceae bacterium]|jgi:tRNA (adenine22-N1)-methyltransferase|nr:SAM-dependent methyltransferase [Acholeplasmataceae bacterium]
MISERIKTLAALVPPAKSLADVGCDHGYLLVEAFQKYGLDYAVAIDNKELPLKNARDNLKRYPFFSQIRFSLSDGLEDLKEEVEAIVIAGMGGILITQILKEGLTKHREAKYIFQANRNLYELRRFLYEEKMEIASEKIIFEDGQYYEIIVSKAAKKPLVYTEADLIFGPVLRRTKPPLFLEKLKAEILRISEIDHPDIKMKIKRIEEELYENKHNH